MDIMTARNTLSSERLHQLVFLNCDTAVLIRFLERLSLASQSRGGLETFFWNVSSRLGLEGSTSLSHLGLEGSTSRSRLGLESLKKWNVSVLKVDRLGLVT